MATLILSVLIFGGAGLILFRQIKKGSSCSDCHCSCPVKKEQEK